MADPKPTYALVSEGGWVHAVHNHEDIAEQQRLARSCAPDEVDAKRGKHVYSVVCYVPAADSAPTRQVELEHEAFCKLAEHIGGFSVQLDKAMRTGLSAGPAALLLARIHKLMPEEEA